MMIRSVIQTVTWAVAGVSVGWVIALMFIHLTGPLN